MRLGLLLLFFSSVLMASTPPPPEPFDNNVFNNSENLQNTQSFFNSQTVREQEMQFSGSAYDKSFQRSGDLKCSQGEILMGLGEKKVTGDYSVYLRCLDYHASSSWGTYYAHCSSHDVVTMVKRQSELSLKCRALKLNWKNQ